VPVKLKAYSLTLLLAYLAILCHNVVPHYHHVMSGGVYSVQHVHHHGQTHNHASEILNNHTDNYHDHGKHHHSHSHDHPHEHPHPTYSPNDVTADNSQVSSLYTHSLSDEHVTVSQPENNHPHGFPWHHHISPANDFNYLRLVIKFISSSPDFSLLAFYHDGDSCKAILPLLAQRRWCYEYPFLIFSRYEPGATGLRGPPSIA